MKTLGYVTIILFISISLSGCVATMGYINEGQQQYPPTDPLKVKIYTERDLKKPVTEIGYVAVHATNEQNGDLMKQNLKKKAAELGANAIVDFRIFANTAEGIAVILK